MKKIILTLGLLYTFGSAEGMLLTQSKEIQVNWKAYKTLGKIGVGGKFTSVDYMPAALEAKTLEALLVGSKVTISTNKIDTGNPKRDDTIVTSFFAKMSQGKIEGKVESIKAKNDGNEGTASVQITMNGKTLLIPMNYRYTDGNFTAEGAIDLADFGALPALASINKSCYDLHEGKTWSDVAISFNAEVKTSPDDSNQSR